MDNLTLLFCLLAVSAVDSQPTHAASVCTLYQFPLGSWLENIAVRANGNLLLTRLDVPEIYQLETSTPHAGPQLLATVEGVTAVFGIDEIARDVFAFAAGDFSFNVGTTAGSWAVYSLDLTNEFAPEVRKVANVPTAQGPLNGLTVLSATQQPHDILTSDISAGVIYHVSPSTGAVSVVVNNSLTAAAPSNFGNAGVNGIHFHPSEPETLYLANTGQHIFASLPVDRLTGAPTGEGHVIANVTDPSDTFNFDDFALPRNLAVDNAAYIVTGAGNSVERLSLVDGGRESVSGSLNSTVIAGSTAAAFGRTRKDSDVLYVVTSGAQVAPVDGDKVVGAQVVAVHVGKSGTHSGGYEATEPHGW